MKDNSPIFIVGTPRSGTTLLAAMLSSHSNLCCGPETHFFCKLKKDIERRVLNKKTWPMAACNFVTSLKLEDEFVYNLYGLKSDDIYNFLKNEKPSTASMLESLTLLYAIRNKKNRWIEKTPRHLRFISKISEVFPNVKFIRILRDPRDVILSLLKVPWGYKSPLLAAFRNLEDEIMANSSIDKTSHLLVKFEDIIFNPDYHLKRICNFLGESYEDSILSSYLGSTQLVAKSEWWKSNISKPLDKSRCYAWKQVMEQDIKTSTTYMTLYMLKKYGYDIDIPLPKETVILFPTPEAFIEQEEEKFIKLSKEGVNVIGWSNIDFLISAIEYINPSKLVFLPAFFSIYSQPSFSNKLNFTMKLLKVLNWLRRERKDLPIFYYRESRYNNYNKNHKVIDVVFEQLYNCKKINNIL